MDAKACEREIGTLEGSMSRMGNAVLRAELLNSRLIGIIFAKVADCPKCPEIAEQTLADTITNMDNRLQLVNDRTDYICGVLSELLGSIKLQEECKNG